MPAPEPLRATRIVAAPAALDRVAWPAGAIVLRTAVDEAVALADVDAAVVDDPHAIVEPETGLRGVWMTATDALDFLERTCEWELPRERPAFAQGSVAGLPVKVWLESQRILFVVPAPFARDFAERSR